MEGASVSILLSATADASCAYAEQPALPHSILVASFFLRSLYQPFPEHLLWERGLPGSGVPQ